MKGRIRKVIADWTSDGSGNASGTSEKINGRLLKGVTNPSDGPTDNYDITLTDADGADLLSGCVGNLDDRDATDTETVQFLLTDGEAGIAVHPAVDSPVTVTIAAAGNAKSGTLILYYEV